MQKFKFLVLDDESGDNIIRLGWKRIIDHLYLNDFISNMDTNMISDWEIDFHILSPSKIGKFDPYNFDTSIDYINNHQNEFDIFIFDLKLDSDNFGINRKIYVNKKIESCFDNERSINVAGLDFVNQLPIDERPKICFSGSTDIIDILPYLALIKSRWSDILIGDFNNEAYKKEIITVIDYYLCKKQQELAFYISNEIKNHISEYLSENSTNNFNESSNIKIKDEIWSLRTLFPRQMNLFKNKKTIVSAVKYIENVLYESQQSLLKQLLNHPETMKIKEIIRSFNKIDFIVKNQKAKRYIPIHSNSDIVQKSYSGYTIRNAIIEYTIKNYLPFENMNLELCNYLSMVLKYPMNNFKEYLADLSKNYGIYFLDIAYITNIICQNTSHAGCNPIDVKLEIRENEDCKILSFQWTNPNPTQSDKIFNQGSLFFRRIEQANENIYNVETEGWVDILRIVFVRYSANIYFFSSKRVIKIWKDGKICATEIDCESLSNDLKKIKQLSNMEQFFVLNIMKEPYDHNN